MTSVPKAFAFRVSPLLYLACALGTLVFIMAMVVVERWLTGDVPAHLPATQQTYAHHPPLAVVLHLIVVLPALPLGMYVLLRRKGDAVHKALGRIWMVLMAATGIITLFIRQINPGHLSYIHIFSILALVGVARAMWTIRHGQIQAHQKTVTRVFVGALVIAGAFTFVPGRFMYMWLFG